MLKAIAFRTNLLTVLIFLLVGAFVVPSADSTDLNQGLMGYWKFDECSGNLAHDSSGNGNNGTINGATWTTGISGCALSFDSNDDYVHLGNPALLDINYPITIAAWVRKAFLGTWDDIVSHGWGGYIVWFSSNGKVQFASQGGGGGYGVGSITIIDDSDFHHVAVTYDGTTAKVYVDGELDNSASSSMTFDNSNPLRIGSCISRPNEHFDGLIDEVRIYNRALNNTEIESIYCNTLRGDANGDGVNNSADVVYLINYLFTNGPAPSPLCIGDCNCDGLVNSADVAYLINYLFVSGPPPGC